MALTLKTIYAGPLRVQALYARCAASDTPKQRQAKHKASSEAQRRMNQIYSYQNLELMLAANFPAAGSGLVVTLTFDDDHLPENRSQAAAILKKFRRQLTEIRKAKGGETVMIWAIENVLGSGRWHVHLAVNATGDDFVDILRCWPYGSDVEIQRLQVDQEKNYESLARYMCKERRERQGLRSWSYTRNCRHPEIETRIVPDSEDIAAPADATILEDTAKKTEWAEYHYIKYIHGQLAQTPRRRPKKLRGD